LRERERMMGSSGCTDQLSELLVESQGIKDLRWGIAMEILRPFEI
jgi:hypothetical protein